MTDFENITTILDRVHLCWYSYTQVSGKHGLTRTLVLARETFSGIASVMVFNSNGELLETGTRRVDP